MGRSSRHPQSPCTSTEKGPGAPFSFMFLRAPRLLFQVLGRSFHFRFSAKGGSPRGFKKTKNLSPPHEVILGKKERQNQCKLKWASTPAASSKTISHSSPSPIYKIPGFVCFYRPSWISGTKRMRESVCACLYIRRILNTATGNYKKTFNIFHSLIYFICTFIFESLPIHLIPPRPFPLRFVHMVRKSKATRCQA